MLTRHPPRGISLIELLVVLAILGIASAAITRIATHQQRRYASLAARSLALAQMREGADVLASELAGISPSAGDIYADGMKASSIDFRAPLGTALLCEAPAPGATQADAVMLAAAADSAAPEDDAAPDERIAIGDSVWLHDAAADTVGAPGGAAWRPHLVTSVVAVRRRCGLLNEGREATAARLTLTPAIAHALEPHAPVRLFRRARYALYHATDGKWYLGFSDCRPIARTPPCAPLQPVAGSYLPDDGSSPRSRAGLSFEYLDAAGAPTSDPSTVAAIVVHLRANGAPLGRPSDTLVAVRTVALRNIRR